MDNSFKNVKPLSPAEIRDAPTVVEVGTMNLTKGLVHNKSSREIELGATQKMKNLRFEKTGIRKDFGDRALGGNADNFVLCLIEHKFIDVSGDKYQRLIRLMRHSDGRAKTEIYNAVTAEWEDDGLSTSQKIEDRFVRAVSVRGVLLFACKGSGILEREETIIYTPEFDDFPAANSLTESGESTELAITPSGTVKGGDFIVYFEVDLVLTSGSQLAVTVGLYVEGILIAAEVYVQIAPGSTSFPGETFEFQDSEIEDGDIAMLKLISISVGGTTERTADFTDEGAATPRFQAVKSETLEAFNDEYTYAFTMSVEDIPNPQEGDGVLVGFYKDDGGGWVKIDEELFPPDFYNFVERVYVIDGMGVDTKFGLHIEAEINTEGGFVGTLPDDVTWEESTAAYTVDVHGYNLPTDGDANHGIEYDAQTGKTITLEPIADAPEATWIESFGDRIIALQDAGDSQAFNASADATHDEWVGGDSVQSILVDTRNDPIDDLQCAGPLTSNILAVIRSRSIMKSFETGNYDLAVGVTHWLEGTGTESPHSLAITPVGLAFFGHDYMVYLLNEGGLIPVGQAVQQEILESLTSNLHRVDGIYDPIFGEYFLGIPEHGSDYITTTYIFDVGQFIETRGQVVRWRTRVQNVQRYAVVSSAV